MLHPRRHPYGGKAAGEPADPWRGPDWALRHRRCTRSGRGADHHQRVAPQRLEMARRWGATDVINAREQDVVAFVQERNPAASIV